MPNADDLAAAQKIANWNTAYGSILSETTAAHGEIADAITAWECEQIPGTLERLGAAGGQLAAVARRALALPASGVMAYDEPYRRGLELYARAGDLAARYNPLDDADPRSFGAAALLVEGRRITADATAYTRALLARVTKR